MIGLRGGHVTQAGQSEFLCEICDAGDGGSFYLWEGELWGPQCRESSPSFLPGAEMAAGGHSQKGRKEKQETRGELQGKPMSRATPLDHQLLL